MHPFSSCFFLQFIQYFELAGLAVLRRRWHLNSPNGKKRLNFGEGVKTKMVTSLFWIFNMPPHQCFLLIHVDRKLLKTSKFEIMITSNGYYLRAILTKVILFHLSQVLFAS